MRHRQKNGYGCNFSVKLRHYLFHNCSEELSWKSHLIICTIDYILTGKKYMLICDKDQINIRLLFEIMNFSPQVTEQKFSKSLRRAYWAKNIDILFNCFAWQLYIVKPDQGNQVPLLNQYHRETMRTFLSDLIFVTNITNNISGEKCVMWRNFSFPCMTIVGKLKISPHVEKF